MCDSLWNSPRHIEIYMEVNFVSVLLELEERVSGGCFLCSLWDFYSSKKSL